MFRIAEESYTLRPLWELITVPAQPNIVPRLVEIAKAADLTVYPGHCGGPLYIERPESYDDQTALFDLFRQWDITAWTNEVVGVDE